MERNSCERGRRGQLAKGQGSKRGREMQNRSPLSNGSRAASLITSEGGFSHRNFGRSKFQSFNGTDNVPKTLLAPQYCKSRKREGFTRKEFRNRRGRGGGGGGRGGCGFGDNAANDSNFRSQQRQTNKRRARTDHFPTRKGRPHAHALISHNVCAPALQGQMNIGLPIF